MQPTFIRSKYESLIETAYAQGIHYFITHPALLQRFFSTAVTSLVLAAGIVVATCFFGYLPQVSKS